MTRISKEEYFLNIALEVSKRSTCLKRQYGCIIVNNNEIIATGYNGSPRGDVNCCDVYPICPRVNAPHNSGDYSDCNSVHAEQNAMLSVRRKDMIGSTMYLAGKELSGGGLVKWKEIEDPQPCPICLRMIRNCGILKVINRKGVIYEYSR